MKKKIITMMVALMAIASGAQAQVNANGHALVDLGLPSGTMWATMNIGASSPTASGDHFAWGETETKSSFTAGTYTASNINHDLTAEEDVATVKWGGDWRMPTREEFQELIDNCDKEPIITNYRFSGWKLTSKLNNNSIILPTTGSNGEASISGNYWSKDYINETKEGQLFFNSTDIFVDKNYREHGYAVRAVIIKTMPTKTISNIPNGWKVNGKTPTNGSVAINVGVAVTVTPANIPAGKKISSIKAKKK